MISPPKRIPKLLRFSLRELLLLVVIVALAASNLATGWRLREARNEMQRLRDEAVHLGELPPGDPQMVRGIAVEANDADTWRWRLHLPAGHRFRWKAAHKNIPPKGVLRGVLTSASNSSYWKTPSEVLVTASLRKREDGDSILSVKSTIVGQDERMGGIVLDVPAADLQWMSESPSREIGVFGRNGVETISPNKPVVLLRLRACEKSPFGGWQPTTKPMPGLLLWLEKARSSPTAATRGG